MNSNNEIRQVILMRTDLNMPIGKMISQGCHASMGALLKQTRRYKTSDNTTKIELEYGENSYMYEWLEGIFTKITLAVKSEEKLLNLVKKAEDAGINTCIITDSGKTVFNGVPTITCACLGIASKEELDKITGRLRLL